MSSSVAYPVVDIKSESSCIDCLFSSPMSASCYSKELKSLIKFSMYLAFASNLGSDGLEMVTD